jgi:hypothetical protein
MELRLTRRVLGWLAARLGVLPWSRVTDPRTGTGTYWRLTTVLPVVVMGLVAGARSVAELEALTVSMSAAARRWFRLGRKLPDTTARDLLVRLVPAELRAILHAQIRGFHRQKALEPEGFRWGVVSMDGKATAIRAWDGRYAQQQGARGVVRTVTATLVSSPGCPCIDAFPIPAATNEMGTFLPALTELVETYKGIDLFRVVMYDAGACSEANAHGTRKLGLHYVMQLNDAQPTLFAEARRVLECAPEHVIEFADQGGRVRYRLRMTRELEGFLDWEHLRTVIHIHRETLGKDRTVVRHGDRYFVSSLADTALDAEAWVRLIRARWAVENNNHHTFDTALAEDARPWFKEAPVGALNLIILRRIAYNAMALFRARTLRAEANRLMPWRDLIRQVFIALITATEEAVNGLRARAPPVT